MSQITNIIPATGPGSGTVTSIAAANAALTLTPNPITATGTIGLTETNLTTADGTVYWDGTLLSTTATGTAGQVLTSGGAGVAPAYASIPASGVTSITGTANEITASAATGAVTLSTPSTFIAPGSITATTTMAATSITLNGGSPLSNYVNWTAFTPTIDGSVSGTTTYVTQLGQYLVIGNTIFVTININISAATGTGDVKIGGLPFTVNNLSGTGFYGSCFTSGTWIWPVGTTVLGIIPVSGTTNAFIDGFGSTATLARLQMTNAAERFFTTFCYSM